MSIVRYQNEAIFVGPSNSTGFFYSSGNSGTNGIVQIQKALTANRSFSVERQDINVLGQLARLDAIINTPPTVSFDTSWYIANVFNESGIGLSVNGNYSIASGILTNNSNDRNIFISRSPQGFDDVGYAGTDRIAYGIGNAFLSNYSAEGSVGGLATANATFEAYNFVAYNTSTGISPAINPQDGVRLTGVNFALPTAVSGFAGNVPAIRYGEMLVDISNVAILGARVADLKIQSFNLSIPFSRESINELGSLYPDSKEVTVPINASLSVEATLGDSTTGSLADVLCNDGQYNISVSLFKPACPGSTGQLASRYTLNGAKLDTTNYSLSVGPYESVSLSFSVQLGGANTSITNNGLFLSGSLQ